MRGWAIAQEGCLDAFLVSADMSLHQLASQL